MTLKGKAFIPQLGRRRGAHLSSLGRWAHRWINHSSPWRMASATPQGITALWLVPNYTAWWLRHMRVNNLLRESSLQHEQSTKKSCDSLAVYTISHHQFYWILVQFVFICFQIFTRKKLFASGPWCAAAFLPFFSLGVWQFLFFFTFYELLCNILIK